MSTDYRDLLIELLLDKMSIQMKEQVKPTLVTASASVTSIKQKSKPKRKYYGSHRWTHQEYEQVAEYVKAGFKPIEIGRGMGIKTSAVEMAIYNMRHGRGAAPKHLVNFDGKASK